MAILLAGPGKTHRPMRLVPLASQGITRSLDACEKIFLILVVKLAP
jgi:hypothetical protein